MDDPSKDGKLFLATAENGVFQDGGRSYFDGGRFGFGPSLLLRRLVRVLDDWTWTRTFRWHDEGARKDSSGSQPQTDAIQTRTREELMVMNWGETLVSLGV